MSAPAGTDRDKIELERITPFKQGFFDFLDQQVTHSTACQQLLLSNIVSREDRMKLQAVSANIDKGLSEIQSGTRKLRSNLNLAHLEKEADREYHAFFEGEPQENQRRFLQFFKTFEYLLSFWREASALWIDINNKFRASEIQNDTDFQKQFALYRMNPALEGMEGLQVFLTRMARILFGTSSMVTRDGKEKKLNRATRYIPEIEYRYSIVFMPNLEETLRGTGAEARLDNIPGLEESRAPARKPAAAAPAKKTDPADSPRLNASGTQPWNNNPFYYLSYDPYLLDRERENYPEVVHFDTHMGADHDTIRGDIIRNFTRKSRALEPDQIEDEYANFLQTYFDLVVDISMLNVGVGPNDRLLFLFHLGPQTFFNLTRRFLQEAKTGTFHRKKAAARVVVKYLPVELMKKILIAWWRKMVLQKIGPEKDDYSALKRIARQIRGNFERVAMAAVQNRPEFKGKTIADILASEQINEIFGGPALIVLRRFLRIQ